MFEFEVDGVYHNRKGKYTVLSVDPPKMTVRYEDGTFADLKIDVQARIWENIQSEMEARSLSRARRRRSSSGIETQYYIRTISIAAADDLSLDALHEHTTINEENKDKIKPGVRLIFYAVEPAVFFAVATVTGYPAEIPDHPAAGQPGAELFDYPIDIDAHSDNEDYTVALDSVELESLPSFKESLRKAGGYHTINEDDFELLAELLTEVSEEDDEELEEDEEATEIEEEEEID
ncbi:MAG: hypothetical protein KA314_28040 [Chloroflexi bacterium]|nr:hypothetical protein [Chloroflexota bacterium]MBP8059708.1 hypothetical protein [Chloroflexota bacterium]